MSTRQVPIISNIEDIEIWPFEGGQSSLSSKVSQKCNHLDHLPVQALTLLVVLPVVLRICTTTVLNEYNSTGKEYVLGRNNGNAAAADSNCVT